MVDALAEWPDGAGTVTPGSLDVRSVSAVFPCYNDEPTIGGWSTTSTPRSRRSVRRVEVIVVNDGSADGSRELLDALAARPAVAAHRSTTSATADTARR